MLLFALSKLNAKMLLSQVLNQMALRIFSCMLILGGDTFGCNYCETHKTVSTRNIYGMLLSYEKKSQLQ